MRNEKIIIVIIVIESEGEEKRIDNHSGRNFPRTVQ